jgi:multiple sugar transport system substrate-binding protein
MKRLLVLIAAALSVSLALAGCGVRDPDNQIVVQRLFGECAQANAGAHASPDGECEIITGLLNQFAAENPDIRLKVNTVAWPGYDQLSAQLASNDAPDLVTMHQSVIADYSMRGLIEPLDAGLAEVGVDPAGFTPAAREGVTKDGQVYGLPFDTWAPLWHINLDLFRKAGLVRDGKPVLPTSPEELLDQARQFKRATGKPYFVQSLVNERAAYTRNLYTYLMEQGSPFFADPKHIRLNTPEARRVVELFRQIYVEGLTTQNQDYAAATSGFINGDGGVYLVGTWMIGSFEAENRTKGSALYQGYTVYPFPKLYGGRDAAFVDGHAWVMPVKKRNAFQEKAVYRLMKFLADHDDQWARTGHLPAYTAVIESDAFKALPHRANIAPLSRTGQALPAAVQRQFAVQDIIGDELTSAITAGKPAGEALSDAEDRVNDLLFHLL